MSNQAGLIETIQDAISIHSIKKHGKKALDPNQKSYSLTEYYMTVFLIVLIKGISRFSHCPRLFHEKFSWIFHNLLPSSN